MSKGKSCPRASSKYNTAAKGKHIDTNPTPPLQSPQPGLGYKTSLPNSNIYFEDWFTEQNVKWMAFLAMSCISNQFHHVQDQMLILFS